VSLPVSGRWPVKEIDLIDSTIVQALLLLFGQRVVDIPSQPKVVNDASGLVRSRAFRQELLVGALRKISSGRLGFYAHARPGAAGPRA
jgi:hypothetical protein